MGRKRITTTNADRQALYRIRRKERDAEALEMANQIHLLIQAAKAKRGDGEEVLQIERLEQMVVRLVGSLKPVRFD